MGILTNLGLLVNGKISQKARDQFVSEVKILTLSGNEDDSFWIAPIPIRFPGLGGVPDLENQDKYKIFHQFYIDTLYEKTAKAFDINGSEPFFPICDPTAFAVKLGLPLPDISLGDALSLFPVPNPVKMLELLQVDVGDIPDIIANLPNIVPSPLPGPPSIPGFPTPDFFKPNIEIPGIVIPTPNIPLVPLPNFPIPSPQLGFNVKIPSLPAIVGCILSKIPLIVVGIIASVNGLFEAFPNGPAAIVGFFTLAVMDLIAECFVGFPLSIMTAFLAAIVVYIKDLIVMIILALIASLIGDGIIVKGMADFLGLV